MIESARLPMSKLDMPLKHVCKGMTGGANTGCGQQPRHQSFPNERLRFKTVSIREIRVKKEEVLHLHQKSKAEAMFHPSPFTLHTSHFTLHSEAPPYPILRF
jgi:hypothetical protein